MTPPNSDSETSATSSELAARARELEPWRQDIDLGPFSTFDVAAPAGKWNEHHPLDTNTGNKKWDADITEYLYGAEPPGRALVVACNAGLFAFQLEAAGWDVVGLDDGSDPALQEAVNPDIRRVERGEAEELPPEGEWAKSIDCLEQARFVKAARGSDATFVRGDATSLPVPDDSMDVVLALGILYHVHEPYPEERRDEIETGFVDELFRVATERVVIETLEFQPIYEDDPDRRYYWLPGYMVANEHTVLYAEGGDSPGMRFVVVAEPGST